MATRLPAWYAGVVAGKAGDNYGQRETMFTEGILLTGGLKTDDKTRYIPQGSKVEVKIVGTDIVLDKGGNRVSMSAKHTAVEYGSTRQKFGTGAAAVGTLMAGPMAGILAGKVFDKDVPQYFLTCECSNGSQMVVLMPGRMGTKAFIRERDNVVNTGRAPIIDGDDTRLMAIIITAIIFILAML